MTTFERCTPEQAGVSSKTVLRLLDALEACDTQMHGLMLLRHGKVFAEGWWKPYAPELMHGLQSYTKTFSGTAVGLLIDEGKLSLDTPVVSIFPREAEGADERMRRMRVRDVLCMGTGMETAAPPSAHWVEDFFATPVAHEPGTAFYYNNAGSNLLAEIVRRVSGQSLLDYLDERLFRRIGIDRRDVDCFCLPNGTEVGGGGMSARLEDCARLMQLYLDGGVANGHRVLSEEWVREATALQNGAPNPGGIYDCQQGYGFQMWRCSYPGAYRADGAMGQYGICFPEHGLLVAINETASYPVGVQQVLEAVYGVLLPGVMSEALEPDEAARRALQERLSALALPDPFGGEASAQGCDDLAGAYRIDEGRLVWFPEILAMMTGTEHPETSGFSLSREGENWRLVLNTSKGAYALRLPLDGSAADNDLPGLFPYDTAVTQARFAQDGSLEVSIRYVKTCYATRLSFRGEGGRLDVRAGYEDLMEHGFCAKAVRMEKGVRA